MIEIITLVKYHELYEKMKASAVKMASGPVQFAHAHDEGQPALAKTYNRLGSASKADILLFCHDDVEFLSPGWDQKLEQCISAGFDVAGVVGTKEYNGGMLFDSGYSFSAGKVVGQVDGKRAVRLMAHRNEIEPVDAVDGMFLAVSGEKFRRSAFDETFDGLWFYDIDYCLRSDCAVVDILISHDKPEHLRGVYPKDLRPMADYEPAFNAKHGLVPPPIGEQRCEAMLLDDYMKVAV